jgi:hypothetical protein
MAGAIARMVRASSLALVALWRDQNATGRAVRGDGNRHILGSMPHRRSGRVQRGVRKVELDSRANDALSATVAVHGPKSVSAALMNAVRLYLELREDERPKPLMPGRLACLIL